MKRCLVGRSDRAGFPSPLRGGVGVGVVQEAPPSFILHHPHLLPPPRKGEERRPHLSNLFNG